MCVSGVAGANLKTRIEEIMSKRTRLKLSFIRKAFVAAAGLAALAAPVLFGVLSGPSMRAQATPPGPEARVPSFEVASLKPAEKGCEFAPSFGNSSPDRLVDPCVTLQSLIQDAYGTYRDGVSINSTPLHMESGPSWMRSDFYALPAKAAGPIPPVMMQGPMLQKLLTERFHLQAHFETREMPVYTLTVGKGGLKVQPLAEGACTPLDPFHPPAQGRPKPGEDKLIQSLCGIMNLVLAPAEKGKMRMEVRGSTTTQLAHRLSGLLDRTVVDQTGITGKFNFPMEFTPNPNMPGQALLLPPARDEDPLHSPDSGPNLFTALQEQLGLKLESAKGPVEVLVIDHVERPTEN